MENKKSDNIEPVVDQTLIKRSGSTHKRKTNGPFILLIITCIILLIFLLFLFVSPQGNQYLRKNVFIGDTPMDKIAKPIIANNSFTKDTEYNNLIKNTSMNKLISMSSNENELTEYLKENLNVSDEKANAISEEFYSNPYFNKLRKSIRDGNWIETYRLTKKLNDSNFTNTIKEEIAKNETNTFNDMQEIGRNILKENK